MAYTEADLQALQSNIAKGARSLRLSNGEQVEFRTLDEMERLESKMKKSLGLATAGRLITPVTSTGWR